MPLFCSWLKSYFLFRIDQGGYACDVVWGYFPLTGVLHWSPLKLDQYSIVHWNLGMPHRWMKLFILVPTFWMTCWIFCCTSEAILILSDICLSFLMIKLKSEVNKNRFCFFSREGENVCFRYTTIIFGSVACLFILIFWSNSTWISTKEISVQGIWKTNSMLTICWLLVRIHQN